MPRIIQGVNQFISFPFIMVKNRNWMIVKMSLLKTRPKRILKGHIIIIMRGGYGGIGEGLCVLKHFEPITLLIIPELFQEAVFKAARSGAEIFGPFKAGEARVRRCQAARLVQRVAGHGHDSEG